MAYYVEHPGGQRYGPAEIPMLNQWAAEGRLLPSTTLIEAATGARMLAQDVSGLLFPSVVSSMAPGPGFGTPLGGYSTPQSIQTPYGAPQYSPGRGSSSAISVSYIVSGFGLIMLCCAPPIGILAGLVGIGLALSARNIDARGSNYAIAFGVVTIVLNGFGIALAEKLLHGLG